MAETLNFLIPIDFNPESEAALEYSVTMALKLNARLHLVHIIDEESPLLKLVLDDKQRDLIERGAMDKLKETAERVAGTSGVPFEVSVTRGKIYNKIIEAASGCSANLIFMGRTDSSDIRKNFMGTNTMHIIREANIPVITLRKKPAYPCCSNLVLPLDLSKQTIVKASNAVNIARILDARLSVVSILPLDRASLEIKYTQRLDEIRKVFESLDIKCTVKLYKRKGDHLDHLNEIVSELKGEMIMIMTQQELNITEYFVGSHAQDVINHSDYPVLSINHLNDETKGIPDPLAAAFIDPIRIMDI